MFRLLGNVNSDGANKNPTFVICKLHLDTLLSGAWNQDNSEIAIVIRGRESGGAGEMEVHKWHSWGLATSPSHGSFEWISPCIGQESHTKGLFGADAQIHVQ